jgi:heterodisulfide reductase subunit A-like polyferredoxin
MNTLQAKYDVLIVGGGIGGMESALTLADMDFKVLLVEKEASIGGKMILLSKVFPTLDCSSCISTPKMAATANHPNITTLIYSEVESIRPEGDGRFSVDLLKKPTFVDPAKCTGCAQCETVCTVPIADEFNSNLIARRAAHIAFPQAVPKVAVIDKHGLSPCSYVCPAGVKPHGYIALVRAGKHDEAFRQHLDAAPLPGSLGRACYAPCEEACSRASVDGHVGIRAIKRFLTERYYDAHPEPEHPKPRPLRQARVAVVGSGPAGLSAAYFLALSGYPVVIFEAAPEPGGVMRWHIPAYRLPKDVLARDIKNITALGVEIRTATTVTSIASLKSSGFDAVFVSPGVTGGRRLRVEGEDAAGVHDSMRFLQAINAGAPVDVRGKNVVIVGGGNVAVDAARSARRLGAADVQIFCLEPENEMPAHKWEVLECREEGIRINCSRGVGRILKTGANVSGVEFHRCVSVFDAQRRFNPRLDPDTKETVAADVLIAAIGLAPNTSPFSLELQLRPNGTIQVDDETLQTSVPYVFAGGDAVTGPSMITKAIGQGKRAAFHIDRFLRGERPGSALFDARLPMVDRDAVIAKATTGENTRVTTRPPVLAEKKPLGSRLTTFEEYEVTPTEAAARAAANRCLDCAGCSECGQCISACPGNAIDMSMRPERHTVNVGSVALATGFDAFRAQNKPALGYGRLPNVIDALQMDRILAPTRPYNAVLRPSDGKSPANIAFVLCTGSRDKQVDNRLCSRVCCMYSLKQAQLLMGALPLADVTLYYIDIRAFGKGYEEFYQQAKDMAVSMVRGKVARITADAQSDLIVHYEDLEASSGMKQARHDLVVLSVGMLPSQGFRALFPQGTLATDAYSYIKEVDGDLEPSKTSINGVFAIGSSTAVRDIPDTILHSGAAAAQIAAYLRRHATRRRGNGLRVVGQPIPSEREP